MSISSAADGLFGAITTFFNGGNEPTVAKGRIGDFINEMNSSGAAHHHLFYVSIGPSAISGGDGDLNRKMNLFCNTTSIPALNVMTSAYRENEAHFEVPYGYSHEPVTFNFYMDANLEIKTYFDAWYGAIVNSRAFPLSGGPMNNRIEFMDNFRANIDINIISKSEDQGAVYTMTLIGAWPKSIGDIQLNSQNTDVINLPIQFVYERIEFQSTEVNNVGGVRKPSTRAFPLNIWDTAVGAADELIQSVTKSVNNLSTSIVMPIINAPATITNEIMSSVRGNIPKADTDGDSWTNWFK